MSHYCYQEANKVASTEVAVPKDRQGFYIMLSVESKKQRLFVNYAVDITDK
jgi:hypothetical protein